jgi:hypothetical protein
VKVHVSITTDVGVVYTGEMEVEALVPESAALKKRSNKREQLSRNDAKIDFDLPVRPFIKRHANGMSGGPRRLTLLVARIAEGNGSAQVQRSQVIRLWNKMTQLMGGGFNSAYETRARDSGWISSPKAGVFTLLPGWKEIFS